MNDASVRPKTEFPALRTPNRRRQVAISSGVHGVPPTCSICPKHSAISGVSGIVAMSVIMIPRIETCRAPDRLISGQKFDNENRSATDTVAWFTAVASTEVPAAFR